MVAIKIIYVYIILNTIKWDNMSAENFFILNRMFTRNTLNDLINNKSSEVYSIILRNFIKDYKEKNNAENIKEIYSLLIKHYKNEYFYKNTLFNKLLLGTHSLNTTTALTELPINKRKADFVLINGKAVVYEIKTILDNIDKLDTQITDYYKAFTHVTIFTHEKWVKNVLEKYHNYPIGISILTKRNTIKKIKKAEENKNFLDKSIMFDILRKKEYEQLIVKYYKQLPKINDFEYYNYCKKLINKIDIDILYKDFIHILKNRIKINNDLFINIPRELKFLVYFSSLHTNDYKNLQLFLKQIGD